MENCRYRTAVMCCISNILAFHNDIDKTAY